MAPVTRGNRYQMAGNSAFQCLFILVILLATATWAYFHFFDPAVLERPERMVVSVPDYNPEARNFYRRKMISEALGRLTTVSRMNQQLYDQVKGADLTSEQFRALRDPFYQKMKETASQIRSRGCPKEYEEAHRAAANALGQHYQSLVHLEQAMQSQGQARKKALKAALKAKQKGDRLKARSRTAYGTY